MSTSFNVHYCLHSSIQEHQHCPQVQIWIHYLNLSEIIKHLSALCYHQHTQGKFECCYYKFLCCTLHKYREWYVRHTSEIKYCLTSILNTFCSVCQTEQNSIITHNRMRHKTWQLTDVDREPAHCGFILIIFLWIEEPLKILGCVLTNWLNSFSYGIYALESLFCKSLNCLSFLPRYKWKHTLFSCHTVQSFIPYNRMSVMEVYFYDFVVL